MIEALVTIVVISVGMLSLSLLQTISSRSNHDAQLSGIAMFQAEDMVERMRVNMQGLANPVNYTNIATKDPGCIYTKKGCTPDEMAKYDTYSWNKANQLLLPGGNGTITKNGDIFTVVLTWSSSGSSYSNCQNIADNANSSCFVTTFHP